MAVLETIRNKFGILITVLIAVALLSFIIDPTSLASLTGGQQMGEDIEVASINGKSVTYTDFNNERQKLGNTQALNNFLNRYLYVPTAQNAGFNVSDEEMYELLSNEDFPSYIVAAAFGGKMNAQMIEDMEENVEKDPSGSTSIFWENLKENVMAERYITKYAAYLSKSFFSNSLLVEEGIKSSNNVFDVEFVMVPFGASDTTVVVSDKEINDYYSAHKNLFTCTETRDIEYVVVEYDLENEDVVFEQLDSVFNKVNDVESMIKASVDNGYSHDAITVAMNANSLGAITNVENIVKWAYKESSAGVVSEIFPIKNEDKNYFIVAALTKINPDGYHSVDVVRPYIESVLYEEKAAENKLAEVTAKINGLTDLNEIADALGTSVSTKENLAFASSDFDPKFTGAASVAETGVVSAPFKGSKGIYVFKVTDRSEEAFYTDDNAQMNMASLTAMYDQMLNYMLTKNVKDRTYLYF